MLTLRFSNKLLFNSTLRVLPKCVNYFSKDSNDDKHITKPITGKSAETAKKLNTLLQSILQDDNTTEKPKIQYAQAKRRKPKNIAEEDSSDDEKNVVKAAQKVGNLFGSKSKEVQTELISKLLNQNKTKDALMINQLITGMKVDNETKPQRRKMDQMDDRKKLKQLPRSTRTPRIETTQINAERVNLQDNNQNLNIFTGPFDPPRVDLPTWDKLDKRELRLAVTHPPSNYFEQMMLFTEQGKVWQFPIDNEQGMDNEKNIYFADHVFLEPLLDDWCPKQGPIRHFMELVCVGLSKNHYLTVEAKREHIDWYKNYFISKEQLLKEIGAIPEGFAAKSKETQN